MYPSRSLYGALICFLFAFCLFSPSFVLAQEINRGFKSPESGVYYSPSAFRSTSNSEAETAEVAVEYTDAYPGSKSFLVSLFLKTDVSIAGFDFEITIPQSDPADFSTVRIYVDSLDTCSAPEETCWHYFPIRECLAVPGEIIHDWSIFQAHGAPGDTTQPTCDLLRVFGIAFSGTPIPPQPNPVTLFEFGVDVSCVPDSSSERTVSFNVTGYLSDPQGQLVPFEVDPGKLTIWWSVPGDANNDSLVDVGDVVFIVNYLFKEGEDPCVMEAADPNGDCLVDVGDVIYLINFLFREGFPPTPGCAH